MPYELMSASVFVAIYVLTLFVFFAFFTVILLGAFVGKLHNLALLFLMGPGYLFLFVFLWFQHIDYGYLKADRNLFWSELMNKEKFVFTETFNEVDDIQLLQENCQKTVIEVKFHSAIVPGRQRAISEYLIRKYSELRPDPFEKIEVLWHSPVESIKSVIRLPAISFTPINTRELAEDYRLGTIETFIICIAGVICAIFYLLYIAKFLFSNKNIWEFVMSLLDLIAICAVMICIGGAATCYALFYSYIYYAFIIPILLVSISFFVGVLGEKKKKIYSKIVLYNNIFYILLFYYVIALIGVLTL